jgi:hypothetical protein
VVLCFWKRWTSLSPLCFWRQFNSPPQVLFYFICVFWTFDPLLHSPWFCSWTNYLRWLQACCNIPLCLHLSLCLLWFVYEHLSCNQGSHPYNQEDELIVQLGSSSEIYPLNISLHWLTKLKWIWFTTSFKYLTNNFFNYN